MEGLCPVNINFLSHAGIKNLGRKIFYFIINSSIVAITRSKQINLKLQSTNKWIFYILKISLERFENHYSDSRGPAKVLESLDFTPEAAGPTA